MARPRHQDGWLQLYKGTKRHSWVAHWYTYEFDEAGVEERKHHSKVLGNRSDLTREEAHAELRKILVQAGQAMPGELSALQWGDLLPDGIFVQRAYVEGEMVEPKTRGSLAPVAIPETLRASLLAERSGAPDHGFVFASRNGGPFPANNWRFRVLVPAARAAGFTGQINFQVLRRTFATLAHDMGVPLKAVQAQLRHASSNTTANVYTQIVTATQKAAVEMVAKKLFSE